MEPLNEKRIRAYKMQQDVLDTHLSEIEVPRDYQQIWDEVNLPTQIRKAERNNLPLAQREAVFERLSKRGYYLTRIAHKYGAKNILEVGTAEGWQFFSFGEYCRGASGHVWSCDVEDKYDKSYAQKYSDVCTFVHGDSAKLTAKLREENVKIDLFYVDGSHERGAVIRDVLNLKELQSDERTPIWIFDDYDQRFGCYNDIAMILDKVPSYFVYSVGKTASNNPNHQVVVRGRFP